MFMLFLQEVTYEDYRYVSFVWRNTLKSFKTLLNTHVKVKIKLET